MWRNTVEAIAEAGDERARSRRAVLGRLGRELAQFRLWLFFLVILTVINALSQAVGPWLVGLAIDDVLTLRDPVRLAWIMAALLLSYVAGYLVARAQIVLVGNMGQRVITKLRNGIFAKVQTLPVSFFDKRASGDLQSRLVNDIETLNQLLGPGLSQVLSTILGLIGILFAMFALDWRLALAVLPILPLMAITTSTLAQRARRAFRTTRETVGAVSAQLEQDITGIREAQAFNRTETNVTRFRERNAANRNANVQAVAVTSAFTPTIDFLSTVGVAIVIGLGGWLAFRGEIQVGVVAAFLLYVQTFFRPIQLLSQLAAQIQPALAGAERIYNLLDERDEPVEAEAAPLPRLTGHIRFDHVTFGYSDDRPVLKDVSFEALPGQMIALVGPTGAGKTTISSLIPRYYDVQQGAVLVDGVDVRAVRRADLRRQIGIVLQDPFLFSGTIADNIAFGRPDATREQIITAAKTVYADEFIRQQPDGYDTVVNEGGRSLSQGQRQLIALARAVLVDPRILILDEATSRIDTRTEKLIQQGIDELLTGRTSLVIAHRLSTVRNADQILVIQGGEIVERGRHDELLARRGVYADLYAKQFAEPVAA